MIIPQFYLKAQVLMITLLFERNVKSMSPFRATTYTFAYDNMRRHFMLMIVIIIIIRIMQIGRQLYRRQTDRQVAKQAKLFKA